MHRPTLKKVLIWVLPVLVLFVTTAFLLDKYSVINLPFTKDESNTTQNGINYGPPTEQEKQETEEFKENLSNAPTNEVPPVAGTKKSVVVTVTSWGQDRDTKDVDATGTVNGEISSTGTCTLTLAKDGIIVSESRLSTPNAQGSSCGRMVIPYSKLNSGTWDLTIGYSSANAEGTSTVTKLEVN